MQSSIQLTECPRDAMQGLHYFIDTEKKVNYIQCLLDVGFETIDFGSFVSSKAIPQMRDTAEVVERLDTSNSKSKLLAIIANLRGAQEACRFSKISFLGYPFSISETFQFRNTNAGLSDSLEIVKNIKEETAKKDKNLIVYLSMAFGNPYGDLWNADIVVNWVQKLKQIGVQRIALSDTIGIATPESIHYLFSHLIQNHSDIEFGAHFHTIPELWKEKIDAAFLSGCTRYDGALFGFGGCPMAKDELTGNMPSENLIQYFVEKNISIGIDLIKLEKAKIIAQSIFSP